MEKLMRGLPADNHDNDDDEITSESDTETQAVDEKSHARLLDAISTMDGGKRLQHTLRTVHGQAVAESGLKSKEVESRNLMGQLMDSLQQTASFSKIKKQLKTFANVKEVETPPPKHIKEKIQRIVGYQKTVEELGKWDPVVTANRKAPQLKFPLDQTTAKVINTHRSYMPVTEMEKEMKAVLSKGKTENQIAKGKVFTPREEQEMAAMSVEEAKRRRSELLQIRAMMHTKNSKLRWQKKIKSKRYRRALKKEKEKKAEKELEELAKVDPEAVAEKIREADQKRILERGRLRHSGGGKFAREARIFAKYDDEKRQQIQNMLEKHRELKKKLEVHMSSSSESEDDDEDLQGLAAKSWSRPVSRSLASDIVSTSAPSDQIQTVNWGNPSTVVEEPVKVEINEQAPSPPPPQEKAKHAGDKEHLTPSSQEKTENTEDEKQPSPKEKTKNVDSKKRPPRPKEKAKNAGDFEKKNKKKKKKKKATDMSSSDDKAQSAPEEKSNQADVAKKTQDVLISIAEAFDDDQVVEDFVRDKEETIEKEREKDIDTFLPGWGRWAGPGVKPSSAVRKRFIKKAPPEQRADNGIGHVIITKKENSVIEKHMISKVPYPYQNLNQMQSQLSKPIGRTFTSEAEFKKNIKPRVVVSKIGQIIKPIDESVLLHGGQKRKTTDIDLPKRSFDKKKKRRR